MRFSGHETFACRYAWLPKALQAIQANPSLFADEDQAMVELGVGKNMVRSIRFWVDATGMATESDKSAMVPTPTGKQIFLKGGLDPFLEDVTTLWLMHWNLCSQATPLLAWDFLFNRWQDPEFTQARALGALCREVETNNRTASEVTIGQHLQVFLHSYLPTRGRKSEVSEDTLDCPLTELELLVRVGDRETDGGGKREPVFTFRRDDKATVSPGLFAYSVNAFWNRCFPNEKTLSLRTLVNAPGSPGQIFKIPEADLLTRLVDIANYSDNAIHFRDSQALPQLHRERALATDDLLPTAYA